MKRIINLLLLLTIALSVEAQLFKQDAQVRVGKLDNGLTYYIRHNAEPENRAYFYIAQKVGAIQEEPHQRGLAHFLEHMCFNGTTHFPGSSLRTYLEKIGVKFGADLNAYTATDETVYNIDNVPTTVEGAVDSCLWILHDWSNDLTLDAKEIDNERGVIQEEWRSRNSASQRMNEAAMPVLMAGSKYTDAMPIGNMDIVMNFKHQALRDYYEKWYRPDLQGIVVVGDIDVDAVEAKIKKIFADIPKAPADAAERIYYSVPANKEPIYFTGRDKEITSPTVVMYFKHASVPRDGKNSRQYMQANLFNSFFYGMFHDHTRDIAQKPNAPFAMSYIRDGGFFLAQNDKALMGVVSCRNKPDGVVKGTEAFLRELFRVRRHGFTQSEFDRYRADMLASLDKLMKDKDKRRSSTYVDQYVRNFLDNEPIPSIEDEVAFYRNELATLTADDLNSYFSSLFTPDGSNIAIEITAPQADSINIPTKEEFMALYDRVSCERLEPYVDRVSGLPFLPKEPVAGKIVEEKTAKNGDTHMTLSNGMKVVVHRTDFKKDEILMQAMGRGGFSLLPDSMYRYNSLLNMMTAVSGWGNYNLADMEKKFVGVHARIQAGIADNYQSIAGSCSPDDLRHLMAMTHAAFLYPYKDADAFGALCQRLAQSTREAKGKPNNVYADSLQYTLYGKNQYTRDITPEEYERADYELLLSLYKERFSDASGFTVSFVGNVCLDSLRPCIEKYLASLPSTYRNEQARPVKMLKPGSRSCVFEKEQETPKSTIYIQYTAPNKFSVRNQVMSDILGQVLTIMYTKTIREEAGAAYSVGAGCALDYYPAERNRIIVRFPTSPELRDKAVSLVDAGIDEIIKNGPSADDVAKAKEYMLKTSASNRTVNQYWQYVLSYEWNHQTTGYDSRYDEAVKSVTVKDIQQLARKIKAGDRVMVVMSSPVKK